MSEFNHYLQKETDEKYYHMNSLSYYYDKMAENLNTIKELAKKVDGYDEELEAKIEEIDLDLEKLNRLVLNGEVDKSVLRTEIDQKLLQLEKDYAPNLHQISNELEQRVQFETVTFQVPSDFPTLQDAIDKLSEKKVKNNVVININMEAGFNPESGIVVTNGDLSHFRITSTSDVVEVSDLFTGDFLYGENAVLPTLACLVDMKHLGRDGVACTENSRGYVEEYCGVIRAGYRGLYVAQVSTVHAYRSIFDEAKERNLWVTRVSTVEAEYGSFKNAGHRAVYCSRGSKINMMYADITGAGEVGVYAIRGFVNCQYADVSGAVNEGFYATTNGVIIAREAKANNCGSHGMYATHNGQISGLLCEVIGNGGNGVFSNRNSSITASNGTISDNVLSAVRADMGGRVTLDNATCVNNGNNGLWASDLGVINASNSIVSGSANGRDLAVTRGSFIQASGITTTGGTLTPSDTNLQELNTLTQHGVIFG